MNVCKTCACPMEGAEGLNICPACLFTSALQDPVGADVDSLPVDSPAATEAFGGQARRLSVCANFFEKYQILDRIGQGGQGEVWKIWDFTFRRHLAMKRLSAQAAGSSAACYRFLAEAQITSQLKHPGILPVYDLGMDLDGKPYYTTDLLPGTTLAQAFSGPGTANPGRSDLNRALELVGRVCEIMAHCHSRGVIHRDLKPSNILVGAFGDVRVIDWGSAHVLNGYGKGFEEPFVRLGREDIQTDRQEWLVERPELATAIAGEPVTTVFAAPERLTGQKGDLGPETDIYSIGALLYELLARRLPYSDGSGRLPRTADLERLICAGPPRPLREINPAISKDLAAIAEKAMAHEKSARYRKMEDLGADIRAALEMRPVLARRPGPVLNLQRLVQRNAGYFLLVSLIVVIVAVGSAVSISLRRQRDVARQVQALRDAELAERTGHWRKAIEALDEAQSAGYRDAIDLGLQRAEAWTVLNEPDRAGAELRKLMRRSDLGSRRGAVLLKMGDYELFDQAAAKQGEAHVREALAARLDQPDQLVAEGLLADSVPKAVSLFQQALQIAPYSYAAHIHSLGMELVLGRHSELQTHIHIFEILYPDDPSPRFVEASEFAMGGQAREAIRALEPLRGLMTEESWERFILGYQKLAEGAHYFSIESFLKGDGLDARNYTQLMSTAGSILVNTIPGSSQGAPRLRGAHLPCLERGLLDAVPAVQALAMPLYRDIAPFIQQIKASWQVCPEAVLPFRAATLLEGRQPATGPRSIPILRMQAELFQMAADSPSFVPELPRTAAYLATKAQLELVKSQPDSAEEVRGNCLRNLRSGAAAKDISAAECRAYFDLARQLPDYDLEKQLLDRWEQLTPTDPDVQRKRIELEIASDNFAYAIRLIDTMLARNPGSAWAEEHRHSAITGAAGLLRSLETPAATANRGIIP